MIALLVVLFLLAAAGWCSFFMQRTQMKWRLIAASADITATKRVGKWYQTRVEELEEETRSLASQIILAGGTHPLHAMPIPPRDDDAEYAYDETGLVRERLDPRDLPIG